MMLDNYFLYLKNEYNKFQRWSNIGIYDQKANR